MQAGHVLESWPVLKQGMLQMWSPHFIYGSNAAYWSTEMEPFKRIIWSVRNWQTLIHRLDLPTADTINLIIGGIPQHSLRATALTLPTQSVDQFLEAMRRITFGISDLETRNSPPSKGARTKDGHKTPDNKAAPQRDSKTAESTCNYCKKKGHWKADCMVLKKKEQAAGTTSPPPRAASSSQQRRQSRRPKKNKFYLSAPIVIVENINGLNSKLNTLMDTGSPVSFISLSNFNEIFKGSTNSLELVDRKFNALPKTPINVLGKITTIVKFRDYQTVNLTLPCT